jgi:threonine dehydratase
VVRLLASLGATVSRCERRVSDPPGDPAVLRFREAVEGGSIPFGVQGPDNALCLDGGRTIGWELADAGTELDRVVVQVGGGAFAACTGWGLGADVRLDAVQAEGCAPLDRAWRRAADRAVAADELGRRWSELMTPWDEPHSAADGILDDETYDWLGVFEVMRRSGGQPLVAAESLIAEAHTLARRTGIPVSVTGSAGLAGLLTPAGAPASGERVAVVFSGVAR